MAFGPQCHNNTLANAQWYQYHEREWARCMACGDNVFGYVGPTTTENKEIPDDIPIKYDDWVPLQHHMSFMKGNVMEVSDSCCGVKWDAWETHLPKSALRKTKN
ncbi:unnamed protein product [Cylicocyclus nassatus]|uniref:Uncharacterized protein n=1 Tax=Cylicocyclus nassatus TaxID=53992 RepID=A0AA36DR74_CYLNA|nr:unnamed protein product [Cylicocyclus nassatus]